MGANSKIEWTATQMPDGTLLPGFTFNPWTGCTKVSLACDHCYAESWANRSGLVQWGNNPRRRTSEAYWRQPLKWNREAERAGVRRKVFCASLADVFDNQVPASWRDDLWHLIAQTPHLDWLLLTKRPQNIAKMLPDPETSVKPWGAGWPNVWLGATVENQTEADRRIPHLLSVPARVHFLSCEPLLGPVDLAAIDVDGWHEVLPLGAAWLGRSGADEPEAPRIDWVICGGESGPHARPMHPDWARSLRDQCQAAGVPYFLKQWGEWAPVPWKLEREPGEADGAYKARSNAGAATHAISWDGEFQKLSHDPWSCERSGEAPSPHHGLLRLGKKAAGALLDGREWREMPTTAPRQDPSRG